MSRCPGPHMLELHLTVFFLIALKSHLEVQCQLCYKKCLLVVNILELQMQDSMWPLSKGCALHSLWDTSSVHCVISNWQWCKTQSFEHESTRNIVQIDFALNWKQDFCWHKTQILKNNAALTKMTEDWLSIINNKHFVGAVYLNFSATFDMIDNNLQK